MQQPTWLGRQISLLYNLIDLLTIAQVSQSHDLLARILQLSSTLPAALQSPGDKFAPVLFDFRFFRDPDAHERKVECDQELTELDEDFREVRMQAKHSSCRQLAQSQRCTLGDPVAHSSQASSL